MILPAHKNKNLENIPDEVWKDIPGWAGYQISNNGRVKSLARIKRGRGDGVVVLCDRILTQWNNKHGYCLVTFQIENNKKHFPIHRLVLLGFVGARELPVDHINGIKTDNRLENLEYVTNRENTHRYYKGKLKLPIGVRLRNSGRYQAELRVGSKLHVLGNYDTIEEAVSIHAQAINDLDNIHLYTKIGHKRKEKCI